MNGPVEPSADLRVLAHLYRGFYVACRDEGFSRWQAMALLGDLIASNWGQGPPRRSSGRSGRSDRRP